MHLLPYAQAVEEARHYVTEALQNSDLESGKINIGNILDPEQEKEILECDDADEMHPDFVHVNPDDLDIDASKQVKRSFRIIEYKTHDEVLEETRKLD